MINGLPNPFLVTVVIFIVLIIKAGCLLSFKYKHKRDFSSINQIIVVTAFLSLGLGSFTYPSIYFIGGYALNVPTNYTDTCILNNYIMDGTDFKSVINYLLLGTIIALPFSAWTYIKLFR